MPNRLIIDRVRFSPVILRSRQPFTARFRVADTQGHTVQGAHDDLELGQGELITMPENMD